MRLKNILLALSLITIIAILSPSWLSAAGTEMERKSLKGLKGVLVIIEKLNPEVEKLTVTSKSCLKLYFWK